MDNGVKDRVFKIREIRNNTETLKWFEDYINKARSAITNCVHSGARKLLVKLIPQQPILLCKSLTVCQNGLYDFDFTYDQSKIPVNAHPALFCVHTKHDSHTDELKAGLSDKSYVFSVCVDGKLQTPFYPTNTVNNHNRNIFTWGITGFQIPDSSHGNQHKLTIISQVNKESSVNVVIQLRIVELI